MFSLRFATGEDFNDIKRIADLHRKELGFVHVEKIQRGIANRTIVVGLVNKNIVGFVHWHTPKKGDNVGFSVVYNIAVLPSFRGKGIARAFLNVVPEPFRLTVPADNKNAWEFYKKYGLQVYQVSTSSADTLLVRMEYSRPPILGVVRGASKQASDICEELSIPLGIRDDTYAGYVQDVWMLDFNFNKPFTFVRWNKYLSLIKTYKPQLVMLPDYESPADRSRLYQLLRDLNNFPSAMPMVCPKFKGAIAHIPTRCRIAISIPTGYAGYLPHPDELFGRELHLLGGHADQWGYVRNVLYPYSRVKSIDGNVVFRMAQQYGKFWSNKQEKYVELAGENFDTDALVKASLRNQRKYLEQRKHTDKGVRIKKLLDAVDNVS